MLQLIGLLTNASKGTATSLAFAVALLPSSAWPSVHLVCDQAAQVAASKSNVPLDVLRTITRAETGRQRGSDFVPWPWTVNMEGAGKWFDTEDSARAFVFRHFKQGARSFDVGCFQINYKWHGDAFVSIEEMFDPTKNALYAAKFLSALKEELGSWSAAVGAYHSRTPKYAKLYKTRFDQIQAGLGESTADLPAETPSAVNQFRLLSKRSHSANLGSLVPLQPANSGKNTSTSVSGG